MNSLSVFAIFVGLATVYAGPNDPCNTDPSLGTQVLPGCTYKSAFEKLLKCTQPFFSGFPYYDVHICRSNMDMAISCFGVTANDCLEGKCETVFDSFPDIMQFIQQLETIEKQGAFTKFNKPSDIYNTVTCGQGDIPPEQVDEIAYQVCHTPSEMQALLAQSGPAPNKTHFNVGKPVCDNRILDDLQTWGIAYMEDFIAATSNKQLCGESIAFKDELLKAWDTRCSLPAARALLAKLIIPSPYFDLLGLTNFTRIFETTYGAIHNQFPLPGCPGSSLGHKARKGRFY